ncbi:MAG: beta-ketoacyl-[acyl-carrier-protein] synthase family protein [Planctomycetota bacterium]|nr:beta-ketoacyl-[acyl-carrier-protein] synthase family protein [Planctomycetota bacterium]
MTAGNDYPRVVITGIGIVSPIGIGTHAFWQSLTGGKSGIDFLQTIPASDLPTKLAAEIRDFVPENYIANRKFIKVMTRDIQLGVAAASLAMADSKLKESGGTDPDRLGVVFGAGRIPTTPGELSAVTKACLGADANFDPQLWGTESLNHIHPLWLLRQLPNMPACHVSIEHDARGPNNTITNRDSSAILALAEGRRVIERGAADYMIVGASTSHLNPVDLAKMGLYERLNQRWTDPQKACRPFDRDRDGIIVGEGAAAFILESYEHAHRRGAPIYGVILGVGAGCDAAGADSADLGRGLSVAVQAALRQAGIEPSELGHINAHGKSTLADDCIESRAYHRSLGDYAESVPVTAMKSYFGHFEAGSGAVELAGTLLSLQGGMLPPTLNYETPDPLCRLNVTREEPHQLKTRTAISVNRSSIGQSAAVVVRAI